MIGIIFENEQDITSDILNNKSVRVLTESEVQSNSYKQLMSEINLNAIIKIKYGEVIRPPFSFNPLKNSYIMISSGSWIDKQNRLLGHESSSEECQSIQITSKNNNHPFLSEDQFDLKLSFIEKNYNYFLNESKKIILKHGVTKQTIMLLFYSATILGIIENKSNEALKFIRQALEIKPDFSEFYSIAGDIYLKNENYSLAINAYEQSILKYEIRNKRDILPFSSIRSTNYCKNQIDAIKSKYGKSKKIVTLSQDYL